MKRLHIIPDENSPAMQWVNTQADKLGARGHVGTHLDCYTAIPQKNEYCLTAIILHCQTNMPSLEELQRLEPLENKALILHTGNLENNGYGTDTYFQTETSLSEESLMMILDKKPTFIIIDSHGIAEKGAKHISFDKICESYGCHVIENVDLSSIRTQTSANLIVRINNNHPSTGKPCELYSL